MAFDRNYGNLIWTNHALKRLSERKLSQSLAWSAFHKPDQVIQGKMAGSLEYQRQYDNSTISLIVKKTDENEWLVLSAWIEPPLPGTVDAKKKQYYKEYQRAGFFGKFVVLLRQALGI